MASNLNLSPEETRAALLRHVTEKCGADAVADLLPQLDTTSIAQCLRVSPADTISALRARARLARPVTESKVVTHDGPIWPVERAAMTSPTDIIRRMAEDIRAIAREAQDGVVEIGDLRGLGWSDVQVRLHGGAAIRAARNADALEEAA